MTAEAWTPLLTELEEVIAEIMLHRRAFLVINVNSPADLFVQLEVPADGSVHAEAVSTMHRSCPCPAPRHLLPEPWQARMLRLGWNRFNIDLQDGIPGPAHQMNFHRTWVDARLGVAAMFSEFLVRTLVEGFEVDSPDQLHFRFGGIAGDGSANRAA